MAKDSGLLISRIFIVFIFLYAGINKIRHFSDSIGYMQQHGIPLTSIALVLAIIIEIGFSFLIILGFKSRYVAVIMMVYLAVITVIFHNFIKDPQMMIHFLKNLAIMGGLLSLALNGPGKLSFEK
jgi:putative oxidoreductase